MVRSKQFRLPSGEYTENKLQYLEAWGNLIETIEHNLGVIVYAFDPGVSVCQHIGSDAVTLPLWLAKKIASLDIKGTENGN